MAAADSVNRSGARLPYTPAFEGLRAFACLTVFLENLHVEMQQPAAGALGPLSVAYLATSGVGVAIFIVLSGALLSVPFWNLFERKEGPALRAFALRRLARLAPAYYACLLLLALGTGAARDPLDLLVHLFFVNNLWADTFYGISPQFWTIGLFAQLYILLPLVFLVLRRVAHRASNAAVAAGVLSLLVYVTHAAIMMAAERQVWPLSLFTSADALVLAHSPLAHLPHFLLGVVAGFVFTRVTPAAAGRGTRAAASDAVFLAAFAILVFLSAAPAADALAVPFGRYLYPALPLSAALAIAVLPTAPIAATVMSAWPLRWLGVVSYGVYIYHVACMKAVQRGLAAAGADQGPDVLTFALVSFSVTVGVAVVSYFLLERPIRRWVDGATLAQGHA